MANRSILQKFYDTTLRTKLIVPFLLVVIAPMILIGVISERLIARKVHEEIQKAAEQNLDAAWIQYYVRADQMKFGMLQAVEVVEHAILEKDKAFLREKMRYWKSRRPYVDLWIIVDREGRVIARLNSERSGDPLDLNGVVKKALSTGDSVISTEVVPREVLLKEGEKLADDIVVPVMKPDHEDGYPMDRPAETDALMLTVVVPVMDREGVIGAIITGDILNRDNFVPDTIAAKIPGALATITKNGVRIATTIPNEAGRRAIGTTVPLDVISAISRGESYKGVVPILNERYIIASAPIVDNKGTPVGSLSINVPETRFVALHRENRINILSATVLGILFAVATAIFVTARITRPLGILVQRSRQAASGNLDVEIPVHATAETKDEVSLLAKSFSEMLREIKDRQGEREIYLIEMEKKTGELSALNEKLQAMNQELEVSLEEAQSQQEELQSANEELTILNEELEKKTNELLDANMRILEEEEELKKTRNQLQLIYNGIKDYIFLLDPDCTILEVNKSFLDAYGLKEEEVIGTKCYNLIYGCREIIPECDTKRGADIHTPHRHQVVTKDNKVLDIYVFPILDKKGNLINKVEYIRDVTVETMLKEQLIQAEKLSSLGEILSGVAHELNNPLTGVIGYCELIYETTKDEKLKEQLGKINNAALRCKKIVENLLSFARQHKVEKQYTNINEIIHQTMDLKAYQLKIDNIDVTMDLDERLPYTMVDPYMMQQVFLNIINNSHLAMKDKGGQGKLTIKSGQHEGTIRISFTDTGIGIPEGNLQKIFEPFFTTREVGKGTGLGLSVSYGLIKEHGGEIYAVSRPGEGATFYIELPITSPVAIVADEAEDAVSREKEVEGSKKRVLLIDDEPTILDLMKEIIEGMGHQVCMTSDARMALEKIRHKHYDLIISDMRMPIMHGKAFYETVGKSRPELRKRIVFTTGDVINPETQSFIQETRCQYIGKPFTPMELKRFISNFFMSSNID